MANNYDSNSDDWRALKMWCWIIGILAVAVLAVIIFVKIVWWLACIGAITVGVLVIWLCYNVWKMSRGMEERDGDD